MARNFTPAPMPVRHAGGHECQTNSGGLLQPVHRRRLRHDCPCRTGFRRRPTSAVRPERGLPDRRADSKAFATHSVALYCEDVDEGARAEKAGATIREPAQTFVTGDRFASVLDPYGQRWTVMTRVEDVSPDERDRRMAEWAKECPGPTRLRLCLTEGDAHGLRRTGCVHKCERHIVSGCLRTHRRNQRVGAVDRVVVDLGDHHATR